MEVHYFILRIYFLTLSPNIILISLLLVLEILFLRMIMVKKLKLNNLIYVVYTYLLSCVPTYLI